jgi:hypothetical protein
VIKEEEYGEVVVAYFKYSRRLMQKLKEITE